MTPETLKFKNPQPSAVYEYHLADGTIDFVVARWDNPDGSKKFSQFHYEPDADGGKWIAKAKPAKDANGAEYLRALYNLPALVHAPTAPVLIVEGEKTHKSAMGYAPDGFIVTTWAGGAQAYKRTDWTPLAGRAVAIWPDNDEPGLKSAQAIAALTGGTVVTIPADLPPKWDLADDLPSGLTPEIIADLITAATLKPPPVPEPDNSDNTPSPGILIPRIDRSQFICNDNGGIKPLFSNVVTLLQHYSARWDLRYDEFSRRHFMGANLIQDTDTREISDWVQRQHIGASTNIVGEAILRVAELNKFHQVKDYLDGLRWDKTARLDHFLIDHAGAEDTALVRAITSRWMIQAIARIYDPGCQADSTLVLEGPQGTKKSSLLRQLFGDRWYTDHLPDLSSKDALIQLRGVWCIEISELSTLDKTSAAKIKQFLTSRVDRYREPYGRVTSDIPRACVFAGTVNPGANGYLKDETGARRFWPITVTEEIDIASVTANRDQLWAEAKRRYFNDEPWYLDTSELIGAAQVTQSDRFAIDAWQEHIEQFLETRSESSMSDIFRFVLSATDKSKWTQVDQNRIAKCFAALNWKRVRKTVDGKRIWAYRRTENAESTDPQEGFNF